MSLALARKYRPKNFAGVAVQSHVSDTLRGAIARGRVAHGYLLCGPRGTGKTTLARVLAMALNCENKQSDGEPCGECISCTRIWSGSSSLDVIEIDAASNRGVDDARELRERAMYAPSGDDRYKVYIVDEAHMLTREAWNALLKILEEPPPRVVFVFATTEPQKIAQAAAPVLSRLQRFDLKRIGVSEIVKRLETVLGAEKIPVTPDALAMIARAADGSMRDALSLTDQVISIGEGELTADRVREGLGLVPEDEYLGLIDLISKRQAGAVYDTVRRLADTGVDFGVFLSGLGDMLRAQLAVVLNGRADGVSPHAVAALAAHRDDFSAGDLLRMLQMLSNIEPQFRRSSQQQLLVEMLLVRFALLDRSVTLEEVLQTLGGGGGGAAAAYRAGSEERVAARTRPPQTESRAKAPDLPAQPVMSPPTPPLRVTPSVEQAPVSRDIPAQRNAAPREPAPREFPAVRDFPPRDVPPPRAADASDWRSQLDQAAAGPSRERLTTEAVRQERLAMLRAQDPVLDAAVRELDLDLLD